MTPYQNRRFDSCFLTTKKVIESGKLGELVEIESHFDNYRPLAETNPAVRKTASSMALACIPWIRSFRCSAARTMSLTICARCAIKPTRMTPLKPKLFYGDMKAIVKTSHLVQIDYPKFIVHGHKGSFVKYGIDQQETSLKANIMPGEPGFGADDSVGELVYVNEAGEMVREAVPLESGDYGRCTTRCTTPSSTASRITSRKLTFSPIWRSCSAALSSLHRPPLPLPDKSNWLLCACSYFLNRGVNFHPL